MCRNGIIPTFRALEYAHARKEYDCVSVEFAGYTYLVECLVDLIQVGVAKRHSGMKLGILGPIVVNRFSHEACQAVLDPSLFNVRAPLARTAIS